LLHRGKRHHASVVFELSLFDASIKFRKAPLVRGIAHFDQHGDPRADHRSAKR